ncbi:MAG: hypothetical protein A3G59_01060 [Candidatus Taylorbacteria bacterium RIFCSPLOWO2_12_FULL_47_20]|uniref:Uncharacterized protein n=2 Tax=Candidatus Tayloriibacteriota TaxID=1817919 RepID=A0A1G2P8T8_9BACT|nr:MAG: hypothetical protein A3H68_00360 [Candidatus Taylorbacteria bacterium RIFCSPLOWO2_02_FULL_46_40]OHA44740.1 MAG: hypothetical protein A3G59_01060 [Candidatus Taylorbacteria bacterium RIFCSPLOWO2_12_FULL_47_20]
MGYDNLFSEFDDAYTYVMYLIPVVVLTMGFLFMKKIERKILYLIVSGILLLVLFYGLPVHLLLGMILTELILPATDFAPVISAILLFAELIFAQYILTRIWVAKPRKQDSKSGSNPYIK